MWRAVDTAAVLGNDAVAVVEEVCGYVGGVGSDAIEGIVELSLELATSELPKEHWWIRRAPNGSNRVRLLLSPGTPWQCHADIRVEVGAAPRGEEVGDAC